MSTCSDPFCKAGLYCPGCENGVPWCADPACAPYCAGCAAPENLDFAVNMTVLIIVVCLFALLFIVWFIYGPQFFQPHANYAQANVLVPSDMNVINS